MQPDRRGRTRDESRAQRRAHASSGAAGDPMIGRVLDRRYRITERIARGGMASVYQAHDQRLDRIVAVKIMHAGLGDGGGDDAAFAARFVREARAAARLAHPNVVAVYDQGEDDGTVFLAMEYVPGHTLRDTVIAEAPMPARKALAVMEPVLGALAAAHRAGLVHRDVKPENVLISSDGRQIKVADFGLARAVTSETQHTSTGVLIGTVSYMAPELVTDGTADARADVYAAGVLLYELLTGTKPHAGETPIQVAYKHVHADVPPPSRQVPGLPAYVDALVARATARDRTLRPADAGVFLHLLRRVQHALANGVTDDPALVADLALPAGALHADPETAYAERTEALRSPTTYLPDGRTQHVRTTPSASRETAAPSGRGRRRRRRGPILAVLALLLAVAVGLGAWWFGFARYTSTPGVLQLTQAAATSKLQAAGLEVKVSDPAYSDTVAEGKVMASDPGAGDRVLHGGTVTITVSKGIEQYAVPSLAGKTLAQARAALAQIKMDVPDPTQAWSETVPAGQVISTSPKAGTVLRPGTAVTITVSKGRQPIKVGTWVRKSAKHAEEVLTGRGLVVRTTQDYSESIPQGQVISQSPGSGTLYKGDTVTLLVSKGPPVVTIPGGLRGSGVDDATSKLEALGLKVVVKHSEFYAGLGYVISVDPGSGTEVRKGSTVTLSLF
ncbi:Stk1 family PASTA domain-containing Ser/Thr kinase [Nocardioides sp. BP30]|uniref:Stk1 family PASTA domain-containing Ser/Thr kinase n=1 Tax=Nocardioides sp. BP30 TaxID=3036374 RepID=UPI002468BB77|nr:Stk1 family PASTA domain-containing Ser/Thr kinase [Nocardioides sp. BP30]WGL53841.1 Stk1 family PASTA domain-containing Ser/Thr kinase [Nocardioides sp. BP30]